MMAANTPNKSVHAPHGVMTRRQSSTSQASPRHPVLSPPDPVDMTLKLPMPPLASINDRIQRKRAARACDQCRRRKSRCDGQMNCSACKTIGLQCSFGHQVKQSRGPAYVAHLEKKISDLQDQLRRTSNASEESYEDETSTAHTSPTFSAAGRSPVASQHGRVPSITTLSAPGHRSSSDPPFEYMDTITTEPRGKPFGIDILRQLCNFCNKVAQPSVFPQDMSLNIVQALDNAHSIDGLSTTSTGSPLLPAKLTTQSLIDIAFTEAFQLWPFVDRSQVDRTVYRLYHTSAFGQEQSDRDDLALVYSVLALGQRFDATSPVAAETRKTHGASYFTAARDLVPLAQCDHSIVAVQTTLCLALYLKAASGPGSVHAYVGAAVGAALRLSLHQPTPCFAKDEIALRQRVWSTTRILDVYISTTLGLPRLTGADSDDHNAFPPLSSGCNAELIASEAHLAMAQILGRAIGSAYCSTVVRRPDGRCSFGVSQEGFGCASDELESWADNCPVLSQSPENMTRSQLLLAYAYDYAQLLLYSPFVHHVAQGGADGSQQYEIGLKAVHAALHTVQVADLLHKKLQFNEAYFFTVDALIFAALTLLAVELGASDNTLIIEAMQAGRNAKELLLVLSLHSVTAAECWQALALHSSNISGASAGTTGTIAAKYSSHSAVSSPMVSWKRPQMYDADSGIDMDFYSGDSAVSPTSTFPPVVPAAVFDQTLSMDHPLAGAYVGPPRRLS